MASPEPFYQGMPNNAITSFGNPAYGGDEAHEYLQERAHDEPLLQSKFDKQYGSIQESKRSTMRGGDETSKQVTASRSGSQRSEKNHHP